MSTKNLITERQLRDLKPDPDVILSEVYNIVISYVIESVERDPLAYAECMLEIQHKAEEVGIFMRCPYCGDTVLTLEPDDPTGPRLEEEINDENRWVPMSCSYDCPEPGEGQYIETFPANLTQIEHFRKDMFNRYRRQRASKIWYQRWHWNLKLVYRSRREHICLMFKIWIYNHILRCGRTPMLEMGFNFIREVETSES
jgi:hypothetical protein